MMLRKLKITARLSLYVILGCSMIVVLLSVINYDVGKIIGYKETVERTSYMVSANANKIDSTLASIASIVDFAAETADMSEENLKTLLPGIVAANGSINGSCFAYNLDDRMRNVYYYKDEEGNVINAPPTYDYSSADWYTLARDTEHSCWIEPYYDEGGAEVLMVTYSAPVYRGEGKDRRFLGVLTADVTLQWIQDLMEGYQDKKQNYYILITATGTVVYHPETKYVMNETIFSVADGENLPALRLIGKNMLAGVSGFGSFGKSTVTDSYCEMAYAPIVSTGWSLGYVVPGRLLFFNLEVMNRTIILVGFMGIVILGLVVVRIARQILYPVKDLEIAVKEYARGNLDYQMPAPEREDEITTLIHEFNKMKDDIKEQIAIIRKADSDREKAESELKIASDIQQSMLPADFGPVCSDCLDVYAFVQPARQVGGDLYDVFRMSPTKVAVLIGDVSGKGPSAALFMSMVITTAKVLWKEALSPAEALTLVNAEISRSNSTDMFVTLLFGVVDEEKETFTYSLAGHPAPYLCRADGEIYQLERLKGRLAGVFETGKYVEKTVSLAPGDMLYMFTDGVDECMDTEDRQFGHERIKYTLRKNGAPSAREVCELFYKDLKEYAGEAEQSDDITMLSIIWKGKG
ncbi:MAG: SpoIIE family protein phosphatase [Abditibacteriota bacterium]|nr:SpoIIE family protein phosphatase [Abditibacteriota bacterium]